MKRLVSSLLALLISIGLAQDLKQAALQTYADIVFATYQDSLMLAKDLQSAIKDFLAAPSEPGLQTARNAWLAAREPYGQSEAFRFYGGPIDDAEGPEGLINAWPLDEAYIDYVEGTANSGIINNVSDYPEITKNLLSSLNEQGAEENISAGYHAIEFLLWGQDFSADGPGNRPYSDYTTAPNAARRAAYLQAATDLLIDNLSYLTEAWNPATSDNYRHEFLALDPDVALTNMLTSLGVLSKSELAGERIFTAFDNQDQEDEHSCFSDNTHRDIVTNFLGIKNVYTGSYTRVDGSVVSGSSLSDVVASLDPDLNAAVLANLGAAETQAKALPAPFDQAIIKSETRPQIFDLVSSLLDLGDSFALVGSTLGLSINTALPE
ncbi:MAG: hypothetical protein KC422_04800 [Trueperaceae bacterium]|nr:hypothetical protein [Trueperaceae bacterium]